MEFFFKKNYLFVLLAGTIFASSVHAFNWSFLKSLNIRSVASSISKNRKVAAIIGLSTAAAVIGTVLVAAYRRATNLPLAYLKRVEEQLKRLEAKEVLQLAGHIGELETLMSDISRILPRSSSTFYSELSDSYREVAKAAESERILNDDATNIPEFLGIPRNASYDDFNRALNNKQREPGANVAAAKTLRQIDYVVRSRFGHENYCAYLQGASAVAALPRVPEERAQAVYMRIAQLKANYGEYAREHAKS